MNGKRILALLLTLVMGILAGCTGTAGEDTLPTTEATGRYVEHTLDLPECRYPKDLVMLSDGRLRVALQQAEGGVIICTSAPNGTTWEETTALPEAVTAGVDVETVALSPDGRIFCDTIEALGEDSYVPHLWVGDADGTFRELPLSYPELLPQWGFFLPYADFTQDGRLIAQVYNTDVREIDLTTGAFGDNLSQLEANLFRTGCGGDTVYMMGMQTVSCHREGQTQQLPEVIKTQLETALTADQGNTPRLTFWENGEGYLFFTTREGLYSYIPGGSVTEELVSGGRTSLGDPTCVPCALTGSGDGSFYLLCSLNQKPTLCRFVYDGTVSTLGSSTLKLYTLYTDEDLNQMISRFQKANLDVCVELEVGISAEDGVTEADAIRTLNTRILAGDGPDLICLDGFNLDSYLEKGILADVSGVLREGDPLLEQVTHCYGDGEKVCAVPTTFAIPAMYGKASLVSGIHDLPSLVAAARQTRLENPQADRVVNSTHPIILADSFYDSCSPAWRNADGTLNGTLLAEFYAAMKELYELDEGFRQQHPEWVAEIAENLEAHYQPGTYTGLGGASYVFENISCLSSGTLDGLSQWAYALAGEEEFLGEGYATIALDGQASHVFLPRRIMGIPVNAANPRQAEQFLRFMLSDPVQSETLSTGFPVNKVTFDRQIQEEGYTDASFGSSDEEGNYYSYDARWPEKALRQQLNRWVETLTTPALTNRTIRNLVMAQMSDCCDGRITPEQAAENALQSLNLYLSE